VRKERFGVAVGGREDPGTGWRYVYIEGGRRMEEREREREKVEVNTPILG
jgi:hypothetical protein